jgi:hypothetical protein
MTQHSTLTASEHGCHPPSLAGQVPPPDCIEAPSDSMQATGSETMLDRGLAESQSQQLLSSDDTVLPVRQFPSLSTARIPI